MTQKGNHTWDLIIQYHCCPACGYITESRDDYTYRLGDYYKDVVCGRCGKHFELRKRAHKTVGPLFGEGAKAETEWGK